MRLFKSIYPPSARPDPVGHSPNNFYSDDFQEGVVPLHAALSTSLKIRLAPPLPFPLLSSPPLPSTPLPHFKSASASAVASHSASMNSVPTHDLDHCLVIENLEEVFKHRRCTESHGVISYIL